MWQYSDDSHGGIVFSLPEDLIANWLWLQGVQCFATKADICYRARLPVGVAVDLEGRCLKRNARLALMESTVICQATGDLIAEATASFITKI